MDQLKHWLRKHWFLQHFKNFFNLISNFKNNLSKLKYLLFVYFLIVLVSTLLLYAPFTQNDLDPITGDKVTKLSFVDALFTASSAFSDTGLTVKSTFAQFNVFGQAIIAILIFAGGIGVFALKLFIFNFIFRRKSISLGETKLIQSERGGEDSARVVKLVIVSVKFLLVVTLIFSAILSIYFYFADDASATAGIKAFLREQYPNLPENKLAYISPKNNIEMAIRFGFFHTISAINNAGFDIISNNSLMPYYSDYFLQICFIILFVIGGLGYPVIYDLRCWLKHKLTKQKGEYNLTLFTKLSLIVYFLVFAFGFIVTLIFEIISKDMNTIWNKYYFKKSELQHFDSYRLWLFNGSLSLSENWEAHQWKTPIINGSQNDYRFLSSEEIITIKNNLTPILQRGQMYGNAFQKVFAILFISLSTRSAGFSTSSLSDFTFNSYITYSIMMFIGAAPSSTGGGIRTTTFALILLGIVSTFRGDRKTRLFRRSISRDNTFNALQVFLISLSLVIVATMICVTSFDVYSHGGLNTAGSLTKDNVLLQNPETYRLEQIVFEICSAFGTTGLSLGITPGLNVGSKIALTIVMFIGQFGISSLLFVWKRKKRYNTYYEYIEEDVAIG
ncbi:TrkH family potassium uptake protein [Mycoplasmopsis columboralis]|uniref:Ktr system potassium uptake protein B n=1 Tax=Mycoplasmopsis columboralis TaxID=171282 RepID=A0A449B5Q3_9BACT|nr:potassium transporter TrkG [Mycoplasmopsis columboralis]VEU75906.1 Ktr system potassium uptake protein B [Mycoplasmopsis columboralis]